jgi:protein-tyrosine phosphatase
MVRARVCFVCLGNICRSPTAEAVMRELVEKSGLSARVSIESAGLGDWHVGARADERAGAAALRRGFRLNGRAQQFTSSFFERFDYVLASDHDNRRQLERLALDAAARSKIHMLRDFDPSSPPGAEVPDPYCGGDEGFEIVLDICEAACRGLVDHIEREFGRA